MDADGGHKIRLEVSKICAQHLPKADLLGKGDPAVKLQYGSTECETQVRRGVYDAENQDVYSPESRGHRQRT